MESARAFLARLSALPVLLASGIGVVLALGCPTESLANSNQLVYRCYLSGDQEVGPVATPAFGGGEFRIDTVANTIQYRIVYTGLSAAETAAHIHGMTDPGGNAGVVHALPGGTLKIGTWNYAETQEPDILAGKTYVNIHSGANPGGEIRGQIVPLNAQLDGAQEVPTAVVTTATGWGTFNIDTVANELRYYIAFSGLLGAETAAHIHGPAAHGANAGVLHGLPAGSPKIGTYTYPQSQEADILAGRTYVNIHSSLHAGGEIRGQIVPFVAPIDAGQEVPPNASTSTGVALISIDQGADVLGYDIRVGTLGTAETGAHIHGYSPPGINSAVQHVLPAGARKLGTWNYPAGDEALIEAGNTYINIHTVAFGGGEIRGQIQGFDCPPVVSAPEGVNVVPGTYLINTPNPFRAETTIEFDLPRELGVRLDVVDVTGRRVRTLRDGPLGAGVHRVPWNGRDVAGAPVPSGVYFYVLKTDDGTASRSMTIIR